MAEISTRVIVTVTTDDGREFTWDNTKTASAYDRTQWGVPVIVQSLLNIQAEDAADAVDTPGVTP